MMLTPNPYQASRPVTEPKDLFGRKTEFELIYQMLLSGESVNVMGARRIGKSSFLRGVPHFEIQQRIFGKPVFDEQFVFAYVDMASQKTATPVQFLGRIASQLCKSGLEIANEITSYNSFETELEQYTNTGKRLILMLDEFDSVTQNKKFDIVFYDTLRYYQQQYFISYVVASSERVREVSKSTVAASPFFNIFRFLHLGLLREDEANDLICKDDSMLLYTHFVKLIAGCHPFFISQLCFYLFYFKNTATDAQTDDKIRSNAIVRFVEEAFDHFAYYWEHLTTDERGVLKKIVDGKKPAKDEIPELMDLEQKALIYQIDDGVYRVFSVAFEGFVKEIAFSDIKEELVQFFSKNTKSLLSIGKYCLDKAIELKKK